MTILESIRDKAEIGGNVLATSRMGFLIDIVAGVHDGCSKLVRAASSIPSAVSRLPEAFIDGSDFLGGDVDRRY